MAELTDSFQKKIEAKDKELVAIRDSEKRLQTQLAETRMRLETLETEVEGSKSKAAAPSVDTEKLAQALTPLLRDAIRDAIQPKEPPNVNASPPARRAAEAGPPKPIEAQRKPQDPNVQRFDFNFPDAGRR